MELRALVMLGLLQGLLEWLPVSSSGQVMTVIRELAGLPAGEALGLAIALHLGTGFSVIILLRSELAEAFKEAMRCRLHPILLVVLVPLLTGALPALLVEKIATMVPESAVNMVIGLGLLVTGALLYAARSSKTRFAEPYPCTTDLAILGLVQAVAIIPGVSRSGLTMAYLMLRGYSTYASVKTSLVTGMAVTLAAGAYYVLQPGARVEAGQLLAGIAAALVGGVLSAKFMLSLSTRTSVHALVIAIGVLFFASGALAALG